MDCGPVAEVGLGMETAKLGSVIFVSGEQEPRVVEVQTGDDNTNMARLYLDVDGQAVGVAGRGILEALLGSRSPGRYRVVSVRLEEVEVRPVLVSVREAGTVFLICPQCGRTFNHGVAGCGHCHVSFGDPIPFAELIEAYQHGG